MTGAVLKDVATNAPEKSYGCAYDPAGNRTGETIDGATTTSTYNSLHKILS